MKTIQKIKNRLIKALGGYTFDEYIAYGNAESDETIELLARNLRRRLDQSYGKEPDSKRLKDIYEYLVYFEKHYNYDSPS